MNIEERNKRYNQYVDAKVPMTKDFPTLFYAFIAGGFICVLGQVMQDVLLVLFTNMTLDEASGWVSIILIFIASLLTGLGLYDRIGVFAGAGSIVPITGFSNSIASPAIEFKKEGIIFGLCVKMFSVAGPVIVNGVAVSVIIGFIYLFL